MCKYKDIFMSEATRLPTYVLLSINFIYIVNIMSGASLIEWLKEQARSWRAFAASGKPGERDQRLDVADRLENLAAKLEADTGG